MLLKLRGRIVEKYGSVRNFSKAVGMSEGTLSLKLTGKISLQYKDIEKFAKLLNIPVGEYGIFFFTEEL